MDMWDLRNFGSCDTWIKSKWNGGQAGLMQETHNPKMGKWAFSNKSLLHFIFKIVTSLPQLIPHISSEITFSPDTRDSSNFFCIYIYIFFLIFILYWSFVD